MDYRDDWRRYPQDPGRAYQDQGASPRTNDAERENYARPSAREEYGRYPTRPEQRDAGPARGRPGSPPSRRGAGPLFGSDYGDDSDRDVVGSSMEVDDYAFFNAGNFGRHYGGGFGIAQPSRSLADRNLREDWYNVPPNETRQPGRFIEDPGHRGRGPRGYTRSDDRILEEAHERLTEDRHIDASNIQVTVANGEVTLDGTVDSRQSKRLAEDLVERISGVSHTQNNLRVGASAKSSWEKEAEGVAQATAQIKR